MISLDEHTRAEYIHNLILGKQSLKSLYSEFYNKYVDCIARCPDEGNLLEIGSGAGFLNKIVDNVITSDIIPYKTVDLVMDACRMPFPDDSIRTVFMLNTLHHIPNVKSFFPEISRCLVPNGRLLIIDQYHGCLSKWIYTYLHHEHYDPNAIDWEFESSGPVSGANGALSWIIFFRDRKRFEQLYPSLKINRITPHTPFRYWLSGGLKKWNLLPGALFGPSTKLDFWLAKKLPELCSFNDIELIKQPQ